MIEKQKRKQLFENDNLILEQRGDSYYLSFYDKDGIFKREVTIKVDKNYKVSLSNTN